MTCPLCGGDKWLFIFVAFTWKYVWARILLNVTCEVWLKTRCSLQYRNIATTENLQTDSGHIWRSHDECVSLPPRVSSLFVWPNTWDIILLLPCSRTQLKSPLTLNRVSLSLSGSTSQPLRSDFTKKVFHVLNVDNISSTSTLLLTHSQKEMYSTVCVKWGNVKWTVRQFIIRHFSAATDILSFPSVLTADLSVLLMSALTGGSLVALHAPPSGYSSILDGGKWHSKVNYFGLEWK